MKKLNLLLGLVGLLIFLGIIWLSEPAKILPIIYNSRAEFILLGLLLFTVNVFLRVIKWKVLLKGVDLRGLLPVQFLGLSISNLTPGKFGEPVKAVLLKMRYGISVSESLPSIMWERVMDLVVLILLASIGIATISISNDILYLGIASTLIFLSVILITILGLKSKKFGMKMFSLVRRLPLFNRLSDKFMETFYDVHIKKRNIVKCFLMTLVVWLLDGVTFSLAFMAIGVSINPVLMAGILSLSVLIGIASFLPGGVGTTEVSMALLLGLVGVPHTTALAGIIIARLITFWYGNVVGGLSFIHLSRKFDIKKLV